MLKVLLQSCIVLAGTMIHSVMAQPLQTSDTDPKAVYRFGVVPQQSASKLVKMWTPLLQSLSDSTGLTLQFATAKDIPSFEQALAAKAYDFAYMNPYHYTVFHKTSGYDALANDVKPLFGIIVTSQNSPVHQLEELNNTPMAFPAPAAFAATIVPLRHLAKTGTHVTPFFVQSHESVYLNVIQQFFIAGGGIVRSFEHLPDNQRNQLKVLWKSPPFNSHPIAALKTVPASHQQAITEALVSLHSTTIGKAILKQLNFERLKASKDSDWDNVRALSINTITGQW